MESRCMCIWIVFYSDMLMLLLLLLLLNVCLCVSVSECTRARLSASAKQQYKRIVDMVGTITWLKWNRQRHAHQYCTYNVFIFCLCFVHFHEIILVLFSFILEQKWFSLVDSVRKCFVLCFSFSSSTSIFTRNFTASIQIIHVPS